MFSFNIMDAPGDTQPDSQMLKTWTSGVYSTTTEGKDIAYPKSLFIEQDEDSGDGLPTDDMDMVASSQENHIPTPTSPTRVDTDDGGFAQNSLAPTSPFKFQTPALAGRAGDSSGQILSSEAQSITTPGPVASTNFFFPSLSNAGEGLSAQPISLTQVFNNTQAPTSPAAGGGATDDIVFSRPSPDFTHVRHSSPIPAYSSPIKATQPETPKSDPVVRSSSEPRTEYVTMKESQERRKLSVGDEHGTLVQQDSWEELSRRVKAEKATQHAHRQVARSLSSVSVPTPVFSRSSKRGITNTDHTSPVKSKTSRGGVDCEVDGDDVTMDDQSQPATVNEVNKHNAEHPANEPVESVRDAARTGGRCNSHDNIVQVPKTSSHPYRTPSGQLSRDSTQPATQSSLMHPEHQPQVIGSQENLRALFQPHSSRESVAVMDSQPDATVDFDSVPRPKSLRFPSSPSTNQYSINQTTMATKTGYTSQVISSSMPPMPPKSSPEENVTNDGEERVPSSPPLLPPDDAEVGDGDVEYDEHTYDEYTEGAGGRISVSPIVDEDTLMDEEDDLPVKERVEGETVTENHGVQRDEDELESAKPGEADLETHQAPEALEQAQRNATTGQPKPPRMKRQDTIPETDALDETQPSFFTDENLEQVAGGDTAMGNDANSTGPFQAAQEKHRGSQSNMPAPISSRDNGSDAIAESNRIRCLDDIYNLPETQFSAAEEDVEMPQLSGTEDDDGDIFMRHTPPALPSAKRRKVTYTVKRKAFRDSPKITADTESLSDPPSSFPEQVQPAVEENQSTVSIHEPEDQGALTAVDAREEVRSSYTRTTSLKSRVLPRPPKFRNQRQGALKPVSRELLQSVSSPAHSPPMSRGRPRTRTSSPVTPTKPREAAAKQSTHAELAPADSELAIPVSPVPQPDNVEIAETVPQRTTTPPEVIVPNRVFAAWPGSHYYPATYIGRATPRQLHIRYDDGNTTSIDATNVRALDLRVGDLVKVDETGMKKNIYVVIGFKDRLDDLDGEEYPTTDQRGHATVVLEEKSRESLPEVRSAQPAEHISVPMGSIYLTSSLWKRLRDRSFTVSPLVSPAKSTSRVSTSFADSFTTPSFTRRGTAAPLLLKDVTTRAASVASTARSGSGVFTNMAFVLTSTTADVDKDTITRLIKSNNGQVLEHGFHELFDYESEGVANSPQHRRRSTSAVEGSSGLTLKHAYKDLGFVALISDAHSRSTKYVQALALNIPCLHLRWIHDSLNASRAAPFTRYLLPAGVSKFLDPNGVIRSRTIVPYDPASDEVSFAQMIQDRDLLLRGQNVLLVTGKSKKEIEKRQPFVFLSHALGSATVGRCTDMAAASDMLSDGKWDWLYVDNGERGVAEAAAALLGTGKPASSSKLKKSAKKRKRDTESDVQEDILIKADIGGKTVRITCAEFVIQSLILGALIEE